MMKTITKSTLLAIATAATMLVTACHHEVTWVEKYSDAKDYANGWSGRFGNIDPTQTWNLARQVTAIMRIPFNENTKYAVTICTANPSDANSRLLAKTMFTPKDKFVFDVPATINKVFATVQNGNELLTSGYYDIVDGVTTITSKKETETITDDPEPYEWIIACEDLASTEDYDFNDVVFAVSHATGQTWVTITPLAAGSTLSAKLLHDGEPIGEIHEMIDPNATMTDMAYPPLNTTAKGTPGQPVTIFVSESFLLSYTRTQNMGGFAIQVTKILENGTTKILTLTGSERGEAPQMIVVPRTWAWPIEGQSIERAYPDFKNWNQDAADYLDWTETNVNTELVVK